MPLQALNMKEQCVIRVINSRFMGFDGSVQNAQTMICAQYATMGNKTRNFFCYIICNDFTITIHSLP